MNLAFKVFKTRTKFPFFSGTYNNQWMVVDYKKLEMEEIPTEGVLTVLEQIPGSVTIEDQTILLLKRQGYTY